MPPKPKPPPLIPGSVYGRPRPPKAEDPAQLRLLGRKCPGCGCPNAVEAVRCTMCSRVLPK